MVSLNTLKSKLISHIREEDLGLSKNVCFLCQWTTKLTSLLTKPESTKTISPMIGFSWHIVAFVNRLYGSLGNYLFLPS